MLANIIRNSKKSVGGGGGGIVIDGGDPYYSAVSLMLSMDGTNGSTTFTDSSLNALTVTASGNAQISTTQSKYGASGYFDGAGDYINAPSGSQFQFGTGDFTVEMWVWASSNPGNYKCLFSNRGVDASSIFLGIDPSAKLLYYRGAFLITDSVALSLNQWYHVALVRTGSVITLYKNGISAGSVTDTTNLTGNTCFIAQESSLGSTYFNGYIDDFRISRFARYVSNFTPPTAALPTTASSTVADPYYNYTSLLLHMDGANASTNFVDSGPNALAVTAVGNAQVSTTQSKYGGASAYFDGAGDYLDIPYGNSLNITTDYTIEFWMRADSVTGYAPIFSITSATTSFFGGIYVVRNGSTITFETRPADGSGSATIAVTGGSISTNTWYHVAASVSSNSARLFINGVQVGSTTTFTSRTFTPTGVRVGRFANNFTSGLVDFQGYIDDLRITKYARYTSAFTPPAAALPEFATGNDRYFSNVSLLLHMDGANGSTTFTDNSSSPLVVTAAGNAQISTSSPQYGTGSATFDGATNTALSLDGSTGKYAFGTSPFTVEFWMYPTSLTARQGIYSNNLNSSSGLGTGPVFSIRGLGTTGVLGVGNVGASDTVQTGSNAIAANAWQHVALVREGIGANQSKIYVNGLLAATGTISDNFSTSRNAAIGRTIFYSEYFTGKIDDIRITKGIARYVSNFTPPTTAFPDA